MIPGDYTPEEEAYHYGCVQGLEKGVKETKEKAIEELQKHSLPAVLGGLKGAYTDGLNKGLDIAIEILKNL